MSTLHNVTFGDVKRFWVELKDGERIPVDKGILLAISDNSDELHVAHLNVSPMEGLTAVEIARIELKKFVKTR